MIALALEFSSPRRSVALMDLPGPGAPGTPQILGEAVGDGARSAQPLRLVETVLDGAGLGREGVGCILVGIGPGSYTGIRSAIALAQGWQLARGVKLLGIGSADAIAWNALASGARGPVHVAIDAQRGEFYLAGYHLTDRTCETTAPLRLATKDETLRCLADGGRLFGPALGGVIPGATDLDPTAAALGWLGAGQSGFVSGEKLEPIYLRETTFVKAPPPRNLAGL
jgi:tRNA threonylcarbamoyl adenosine modification protein YeaZ